MAGPLPRPITLSPPQQAVLDALLRQHATPQTLALRVRIVLAAAAGMRNLPITRALGCSLKTVIKWRARWAAAESQLAAVENESADLKALVGRVLADAPRPGAPDTCTAEQSCRSSTWPARPQPTLGSPWMPGHRASWPTKQSNARLFPQFRPLRWGAF